MENYRLQKRSGTVQKSAGCDDIHRRRARHSSVIKLWAGNFYVICSLLSGTHLVDSATEWGNEENWMENLKFAISSISPFLSLNLFRMSCQLSLRASDVFTHTVCWLSSSSASRRRDKLNHRSRSARRKRQENQFSIQLSCASSLLLPYVSEPTTF